MININNIIYSKIINMAQQDPIRHACLYLPYFKQGDDLDSVIVMNDNGKVNAKATLLGHIDLLKFAIAKLQSVHDLLPDDNTLDIHGDTHCIFVNGKKSLIELLVQHDLVRIDSDDEEEDDEEEEEDDQGYDYEEVPIFPRLLK